MLSAMVDYDLLESEVFVLIGGDGETIFSRRENNGAQFNSLAVDLSIYGDGFLLGRFDFLGRGSKETQRREVLFHLDKGRGGKTVNLLYNRGQDLRLWVHEDIRSRSPALAIR